MMEKTTTIFTALLLLLAISSSAIAGDVWFSELKGKDYRNILIGEILLVADWRQTQYISTHSDKYHEHNAIMGRHPSRSSVDLYFVSTAVIYPLIVWALPDTKMVRLPRWMKEYVHKDSITWREAFSLYIYCS